MNKKKTYKALRPVSVDYQPGETFDREYSPEVEEYLITQGVLEIVSEAKSSVVSATTKPGGTSNGKN